MFIYGSFSLRQPPSTQACARFPLLEETSAMLLICMIRDDALAVIGHRLRLGASAGVQHAACGHMLGRAV